MNNVAEMKKALNPGVKVTVVSAPFWPAIEGVTREVGRVQTKRFTLWTINRAGELVESWQDFPKASSATFDGDRVTFPRFDDAPEMGSFTYQIEGA